MDQHIGTKVLRATAMTLGDYNTYVGFAMLDDEDPMAMGYLVEYQDGGKPNHPKHAGYISWSPKAVFEASYRKTTGMNFGLALEALKMGKKVARAGWNGKGMWLSLSGPIEGRRIPASQFWSKNNRWYAEEQPEGQANVLPCITMKTADGSILMGWLASQTDMLSDDWTIIE